MRISDWSSDVCSSDLADCNRYDSLRGFHAAALDDAGPDRARAQGHGWRLRRGGDDRSATQAHDNGDPDRPAAYRNDAPSRSLGSIPDDSNYAAGGAGPGHLRLLRNPPPRKSVTLAAKRSVFACPETEEPRGG